jgi:hypothetical protein
VLRRQFIWFAFFIRAALICSQTPDDSSQTLDVTGDHGEGYIPLEPDNSVIPAQVQTVDSQGVDRRFHC